MIEFAMFVAITVLVFGFVCTFALIIYLIGCKIKYTYQKNHEYVEGQPSSIWSNHGNEPGFDNGNGIKDRLQ